MTDKTKITINNEKKNLDQMLLQFFISKISSKCEIFIASRTDVENALAISIKVELMKVKLQKKHF